jgi:hypothetical protein
MKIAARVKNQYASHSVALQTGEHEHNTLRQTNTIVLADCEIRQTHPLYGAK